MGSKYPAIGIDLGTTYSCVGVFRNGAVEIIENTEGKRTTPSCVAFTEKDKIVGEAAKNDIKNDPKNSVSEVKRLIGRQYSDPDVQKDMKRWPFKVIDSKGNPEIQVQFKGVIRNLRPEEISAMVLGKMKYAAQVHLNAGVGEKLDAVVTVPARFNNAQKQATLDAGKIANLNILNIITEPSAAAFAYGLEKKLKKDEMVLIFDLGGGTLDVSILKISNGEKFEVISTAGNTHLGGEDFDTLLQNHFAEKFKLQYKKDLTNNSRAMRRLRTACQEAKELLSSTMEATISLDCLHEGHNFKTAISRVGFEQLCDELFRSTLVEVEEALTSAGISKTSLQEIVLVGGSSRIPKVQKLLQEFFPHQKLNLSINADEAIAYGAAIQAAILRKDVSNEIKNFSLREVAPLSLGVRTHSGITVRLISRNTPIPVKKSSNFTTVTDDQVSIRFGVMEGERAMDKDNNEIGFFSIDGIPKALRGVPSAVVEFEINADGILSASANEKTSGNFKKVHISRERNLCDTDITRMIEESQRFEHEDAKKVEKARAWEKLESYLYSTRRAAGQLPIREKNRVMSVITSAYKWAKDNQENPSFGAEDYAKKLRDVQATCNPSLKVSKKNNRPWYEKTWDFMTHPMDTCKGLIIGYVQDRLMDQAEELKTKIIGQAQLPLLVAILVAVIAAFSQLSSIGMMFALFLGGITYVALSKLLP